MTYDPTVPLVMAAFRTVHGHNLNAGLPLTVVDEPSQPGEVDGAMHRRLYAAQLAVPAEQFRPTPVESREAEARRLVRLEETGGGWWSLNAPWLDAPRKIQGEDAARLAYADLVAAGRPDTPENITGPQDGPGTNPTNAQSAEAGQQGQAEAEVTSGAEGDEGPQDGAPGGEAESSE